ncbi:FAD-binding domain-containing protein [Ascobolus immersus RN42]|uniref:FAD-binding domain-containing protein n=1 Tax=Ascobolus immersus RN42 TaxID=1160509 RepID=A0A3N4IF08_ASCIM|nr:FAD-binding domain-containing protein [Ascobolus immersus RN42]
MRFFETLLPFILASVTLASPEPQRVSTTKSKCADPLSLLKKAVRDDAALLIPGSVAYESEMTRSYNYGATEIRPKVIARPLNSQQAAKVVKALVDNDCKFAIMSGGHSPIREANHSPNVIISTSGLKVLEYIKPGVLSVSPGYRWKDVYPKALEVGHTAVGGRHSDVGVGGFLLGGGISHLSFKHGWGSDNVVNYELVLPSGKLINVNKSSHPKLFWALKGGLNNFGLVTRFDIKTYPTPKNVIGGANYYLADKIPTIMAAFNKWQYVDQPKNLAQSLFQVVISGPNVEAALGAPTLTAITAYEDSDLQAPGPGFTEFTNIESVMSTIGPRPSHLNLTIETSAEDTHDYRQMFYTGTFRADPRLSKLTNDLMQERLIPLLRTDSVDNSTSYCSLALQPISKSFLSKGYGTSAITLDPKKAPYTVYLYGLQYSDPKLDAPLKKATLDIIAEVKKEAKKLGKGVDFVYGNDLGEGQQGGLYGAMGVSGKLRQIRKEYGGAKWSKLVSGGYKF